MQLPSGRHVALQATPLFDLLDRAASEECVITRLLRIERREHLWPYLDVMFFHPAPVATPVAVAPGGLGVPAGLAPRASGFTLATIAPVLAGWSAADREAFASYLVSERVEAYLDALLGEVERVRGMIAAQGDFTTRLQALMWRHGCHPVRECESDDPLFDLLEDPYDPNAGH
jgi:hypothetical protein